MFHGRLAHLEEPVKKEMVTLRDFVTKLRGKECPDLKRSENDLGFLGSSHRYLGPNSQRLPVQCSTGPTF